MKKLSILKTLIPAGVLLMTAFQAHAAPIFVSGFSENGLPSGGYDEVASGTIGPWTIGGAGVDLIGTYWQAADGDQVSLDMNMREAGSVSTTLNTVAGTAYTVTFSLAGNPDSLIYDTNQVKTLRVTAGGSTRDYTFDVANALGQGSPSSLANMGWVTYTFVFLAQGNDTLTFTSMNTGTMWGPALDNVSVSPNPVPEPATTMLLGAGLMGLYWLRRRTA